MSFLVATNVVASRPPECWPLMTILDTFEIYAESGFSSTNPGAIEEKKLRK